MYESGLSVGDVAEFHNMNRQAMWMILKRRDVVMRPRIRTGVENTFHRGGPSEGRRRAGHITEKAIKKGLLTPPAACEKCSGTRVTFKDGRRPLQAHHCDYNKPLDVMWLCQPCHHEWHRNNKPIPLASPP